MKCWDSFVFSTLRLMQFRTEECVALHFEFDSNFHSSKWMHLLGIIATTLLGKHTLNSWSHRLQLSYRFYVQRVCLLSPAIRSVLRAGKSVFWLCRKMASAPKHCIRHTHTQCRHSANGRADRVFACCERHDSLLVYLKYSIPHTILSASTYLTTFELR